MEFGLARSWWLIALRGVLAIAFGILTFFWPAFFWGVVVALFAIYAFLDGVFALVAAFTGHRQASQWWALVLEGLVGIGIGIIALVWPGLTGLALLYLIAFWAIFTGVFEVVTAIRLRDVIRGEWALGLSGALSIVFGVVLMLMPAAGALAVAWLIGTYAIVIGVLLLAVALRLRTFGRRTFAP
jgi:uncharacterized membrane protein HdeD (DUF308 family)